MIATKVHGVMRDEPNGRGLSRKAIFYELDQSLRRLGTDYVDLYQIHRWDYGTPIEETLEALHDLVKSGKVRYIGASSMYAWQFTKALYLADLHGWTRFVSMQNHYNLLYREEEREMIPLCRAEGIGVIPWSPLARGRLARPAEAGSTKRLGNGPVRKEHVRADRGGGPQNHRPPGSARGKAWRLPRSARAGLDARQAGSCLAHCGCYQAQPPEGRGGGALGFAHPGGDGISRGAVHAACESSATARIWFDRCCNQLERGLAVRVSLFITCYNDTLFPQTGKAVVQVLERLGHQVEFLPAQSCCGQMHWNTGYLREAIPLIRHFAEVFRDAEVICIPSSSCVAMIRDHYVKAALEFGDGRLLAEVESVIPRVFEFSEFLVRKLGVEDVGATYPHRVTYHASCHSLRSLDLGEIPFRLLKQVRGLELVDLEDLDRCCGFGGTFSIKNADVSSAMLSEKVCERVEYRRRGLHGGR